MPASRIPENDAQRLAALQALEILDTPPEAVFDAITQLAASICGSPISLISLVDKDRQWFKSAVGLGEVRQTPRAFAFCGYAILSNQLLEVADASKDPRFSDNPLVTGAPFIRHYAGVPLINSAGLSLGTLCVIDHAPRMLSVMQQTQLQLLGDIVVRLFSDRLRRNELIHELAERERRATASYRDTPAMLHSIDLEGRLLDVSHRWLEVMGYSREEVIGRSSMDFLTEESRRFKSEQLLPAFRRTGECRDVPYQMVKKNGEVIDVLFSAAAERDSEGAIIRSLTIVSDVTEHNRLAAALQQEHERTQVTLESIGDAVISTDAEGKVEYLNPVAEEMTGWPLEDARGRRLGEVFRIINETTRNPAEDPVSRCIAEGRVVGLASHTALISRDGREFSIEDSAAPIRDRSGEIIGSVLVFHDVSAQRRLQTEITHQARHDALTGLANRSEFEIQLRQAISEASDSEIQHALCYLDLDQFKLVNDTCGHAAGDELLRQLTAVLKRKIRHNDLLARLGGDEFGVLLRNCTVAQAGRLAESLRAAVDEFRFFWEEKRFRVGASIGLVPVEAGDVGVESVLRAADSACYAAKDGGRNRIHVFHENDEALARRHGEMQWVSEIAAALEEGRFRLFAQTIHRIDGESAARLHFEILVRLQDRKGIIVPPGAFLPAAERYHLAVDIDRWVVATALNWLAAHPEVIDRLDLCAINLSGQSIGDPQFHGFVAHALDASGVRPEVICFEITETAAVANLASATAFMESLKARGCRFALDDFGSGVSSFGYLKNLPIDIVKIDGLFVRDVTEDPVDYAFVRSINEIAQLLGKKTIAEYVENVQILRQMGLLGVDYAQGFGMGIPVPLENLAVPSDDVRQVDRNLRI